jgi:hypothetical protein
VRPICTFEEQDVRRSVHGERRVPRESLAVVGTVRALGPVGIVAGYHPVDEVEPSGSAAAGV